MMTNQEVRRIALQQSAYDSGCEPEDFLKAENVMTISKKHPLARKYLKLPLSCNLVSYGTNIVAQASEEIAPLVKEYIDRYSAMDGVLAWKMPGAGGGGYLALVCRDAASIPAEGIRLTIRRKQNL